MSTNPNGNKDVVYVDVDEEITGIIDKVRSSGQRIVALVLPKRSTVMQSIVNMKLLKRTADEAKKHVVLITSESGLYPMAGSVGLYVAKNLQSKPEIPTGPGMGVSDTLDDSIDEPAAFALGAAAAGATAGAAARAGEPELDKAKPVGQFPGASSLAATGGNDEDETIELDDEPETEEPAGGKVKDARPARKAKGGFKIPDFNKFRLWLALGGAALVALIVFLYFAIAVMPRATVAVKTDSTAIPTNVSVTLAAGSVPLDVDRGVVPAQTQEVTKTLTQQANATGELDKGTKATGEVTISLKDCSKEEVTIPAGTAVTYDSLTYITQEAASVASVKIGPECRNSDFPNISTDTVNVTAISGGEKYNIGAKSGYKVAGGQPVTASGSAMEGGTTNVVKTVTQADIDGATQKIGQQDTSTVKAELEKGLKAKGLYAVVETFKAGDTQTSTSVQAGAEAENVTVTQKITYTMIGAKQDDLKKILQEEVTGRIDPKKQSILDYGFNKLTFTLTNQDTSGVIVTMDTKVVVGSDLDVAAIKKQIAGKKSSEAQEIIKAYPGVTEVEVKYSPFWVSSIPGKTSKITLNIEEPTISNAKSEN